MCLLFYTSGVLTHAFLRVVAAPLGFFQGKGIQRVLLIEILKILLISGRVEKQDLETVAGEVEGGTSWPWVCLESLGCSLPSAVRSSSPAQPWGSLQGAKFFPELQGSSGTCSLPFLHGMGEAMGEFIQQMLFLEP